MIKNYLLIAIRNILRNRTISFINIFGLSISMSICLLLIIIVADQFAYDDFHENKDNIYRVITDRTNEGITWSTATTTYPLSDALKDQNSIKRMTVVGRNFAGIAAWNDQEIPFSGYNADNNFLSIFNFPLKYGSVRSALTEPNSIVISNQLAQKIFGSKDPINEVLAVEGQGEYKVTGVLEDFPGKTHFNFEALASFDQPTAQQMSDSTFYNGFTDWSNIYQTYIYFETEDNANLEGVKASLARAATSNYDPEGEYLYEFKIQKLNGITPGPLLSNTTGFGLPDFMIYIMLGIALIVLCSACFNYANLTTARAMNRAKEIGVRKVIGARKRHIFFQFMTEALIISVIAFVFADLLTQFLLPQMNSFFASVGAPVGFNETRGLYWWFLGFVILAGLAAGVVPSVFFSATNPLQALKKTIQLNKLSGRLGFSRFDMRKVLVVIQFAFSIFFVITVVTIYQQSKFVLSEGHGFETEGVVNVHLQGVDYEKVRTGFAQISGVKTVASTTFLPALGSNNTAQLTLPGQEEPVIFSFFGVDQNYINSLGLELLAGRGFPEVMPKDDHYVIINETAVKQMGLQTPMEAVGEVLVEDEHHLEVIGVVKDFHYERMDEKIGPLLLRYQPQNANNAIVVLDERVRKDVVAELGAVWKEVTNRPFEYTYFEDDLKLSYGFYEALVMTLGYITLIVISISCLGLLGMVIYHIQNKTKELGIRKTLGAEAINLLSIVGKGFLIMILIAYAIGAPIAYFVNNMWLQQNAYHINFGWQTMALGFVLVMIIVISTVAAHLYKAIRVNPIDSLTSE
ncbi:ABC transporter permease [Fulvivirga ligni]|uniref:ABC transporter permease n=1 Tax=Fulvivirga ligni TaxID=2904246 RepID=UPI001F30F38D|nr:ABC transporter permease [Fulvivirga ligni]UII20615.1 ABC transporter permease [Fulvivirga ligni]